MENINSEVVVVENKVENASYTLIKALKADIKAKTEVHVKNKRENGQDRYVSQEIRAHLIAYCLLRGKSYKEMEKKCSEFDPSWWDWRILIKNIHVVCLKYSLSEDHEKWTIKNIEQIIAEARAND